MKRRTTCIHCDAPLVRVWHWGVCPVHSAAWLRSVRMPTIADQIAAQVGGLLTDKGRPPPRRSTSVTPTPSEDSHAP